MTYVPLEKLHNKETAQHLPLPGLRIDLQANARLAECELKLLNTLQTEQTSGTSLIFPDKTSPTVVEAERRQWQNMITVFSS